mgnify:CR=1 FL=1
MQQSKWQNQFCRYSKAAPCAPTKKHNSEQTTTPSALQQNNLCSSCNLKFQKHAETNKGMNCSAFCSQTMNSGAFDVKHDRNKQTSKHTMIEVQKHLSTLKEKLEMLWDDRPGPKQQQKINRTEKTHHQEFRECQNMLIVPKRKWHQQTQQWMKDENKANKQCETFTILSDTNCSDDDFEKHPNHVSTMRQKIWRKLLNNW